jgi:basic amino acid/polyamine antiporter, APA family
MTPAPAPANQLPRVLGPWMATAIVIGTVIGSGVFKKPQFVAERVDTFGLTMLAWVLIGLLALFGALALAEIAVLLPRAGGNYVFLKEAYGRWAGFLWGWVEFWIIRSASIAALASVFTESFHTLLRHADPGGAGGEVLTFWQRQGVTATVIAVLGLVNARGTRWGGGLQVLVTTVKVLSLLGIALLPFIILAFFSEHQGRVHSEYLSPAWPADWGAVSWSGFGAALVGVYWAYHGWMNIAPVAEDVRNPSRNIPLALLTGVLTIIVLYLSVNLAYHLVVPHDLMKQLKDPMPSVAEDFALRLLGPIGSMFASLALMTSVFGSLNGNLLVGPRLLFAMGRDGLAPRALSRLHPRYQTPALAELILVGWSITLVVAAAGLTKHRLPVLELGNWTLNLNVPAGKSLFDVVTDFAMFGALTFETLAVTSLFVFRRRFPPSTVTLPYRCPLYPWVPLAYVVAMTAVVLNMFMSEEQRAEALFGVGFIGIGALVYLAVFARRSVPSAPTS